MGIWDAPRKERKGFSQAVKNQTLREQNDKCNGCDSRFSSNLRAHYDHIDGDRSNNHPDNCQALCPNCHDQKSLRESDGNNYKKQSNNDPFGIGKIGDMGFGTSNSNKSKSKKRNDNPFGNLGDIGF